MALFHVATSAATMTAGSAARVPFRRRAVPALAAVPYDFAIARAVAVAHAGVVDQRVRVDVNLRLMA